MSGKFKIGGTERFKNEDRGVEFGPFDIFSERKDMMSDL